ncbi:MAG: hypothetical protein ACRDCG_00005 [Mycoplasmoidaceae bacterium]
MEWNEEAINKLGDDISGIFSDIKVILNENIHNNHVQKIEFGYFIYIYILEYIMFNIKILESILKEMGKDETINDWK